MKRSSLFLFAILISFIASSQVFKKDDAVEVDPLLSDSLEGTWRHATVVEFDSIGNKYLVKLVDGNKMNIPSKSPEQWIRPFVNRQVVNKYGPGARIPYEKSSNVMKNTRCNGSEAAVKRNIKSQMASFYKDYPYIMVDFTSFKAQTGYDSKKNPGYMVYPYKIEMLVHVKRSLMFAGRMYTEYQTWEFDREYEYATRAGKACDFYASQLSEPKLISKGWY